jgi:AraC-like DNA-binding protein
MHRRKAAPAQMRAFFGCDVLFGQNADEIVYPAAVASAPVTSADPFLNSLLLQYCDEALAGRKKAGSWRLRVENAIVPLLPHGQAQMTRICSELGVSRRTLVRRLDAEGCSFSEILDGMKRELAHRYLREPDLPVSEIAWLLGYSETSAFNHAFRRWTGTAPSQFR